MAQREYSGEGFTITWDSSRCIHSERCWRGLPEVFDPQRRPWINAAGAEADRVAEQIAHCPSGALGFIAEQGTAQPETKGKGESAMTEERVTIEPTRDGPYEVIGEVTLKDSDGNDVREARKLFLCRCGASETKPYCDGSHKRIGFRADD